MLKSLRQTSMVDSPVGAYFTSPTGAFFKNALVEALSVYQAFGGRKGVVLLHGASPPSTRLNGKSALSQVLILTLPLPRSQTRQRAPRAASAFGPSVSRPHSAMPLPGAVRSTRRRWSTTA